MTVRFICTGDDDRFLFYTELTLFLRHLRKQGVRYSSQYFDEVHRQYYPDMISEDQSLELWIRYVGEDDRRQEILDRIHLYTLLTFEKYSGSARLEIEK